MRRTLVGGSLAVVLASLLACGGPAGPTTPTPPTPTYPSLTGNWAGTGVIVVAVGSASVSNTCTVSVTINSQTGGAFGGTYQVSGGTSAPCGAAGALTGAITPDGTVTAFTLAQAVGGAPAGCTQTSASPTYTGLYAGGVIRVTANAAYLCGGATATKNSTISITRP